MRQFLEALVSERVELRFDLARALPPIAADAAEIRQLVINIVTNASEALDGSEGVITVKTHVEHMNRARLAAAQLGEDLPAGDFVVFEVADTGCGMDRATSTKIFDPFFSTKFAGRGLGLPAVLGIVRGSGGVIDVDSTPGVGTTVRVSLPYAAKRTTREPTIRPAAEENGDVQTILVADDDESIRSLSREMLEQAGFEVELAEDGQQAVDIFRESPGRFGAVLLDMTMPRLNGEEAFRGLLEIRNDVPVIVASGYSEQIAMDRFDGRRPSGFLQKPYRLTQLVDEVRRVLGAG
jgi:CheY-like chemotaxis protein